MPKTSEKTIETLRALLVKAEQGPWRAYDTVEAVASCLAALPGLLRLLAEVVRLEDEVAEWRLP